jgi:hypothetical protein
MAMNPKSPAKLGQRSILRSVVPFETRKRRLRKAAEKRRPMLAGAIANPQLHTIVALNLIGVLLLLNIILRFPDVGSIIAEYNKF